MSRIESEICTSMKASVHISVFFQTPILLLNKPTPFSTPPSRHLPTIVILECSHPVIPLCLIIMMLSSLGLNNSLEWLGEHSILAESLANVNYISLLYGLSCHITHLYGDLTSLRVSLSWKEYKDKPPNTTWVTTLQTISPILLIYTFCHSCITTSSLIWYTFKLKHASYMCITTSNSVIFPDFGTQFTTSNSLQFFFLYN